MTTMRCAVLSAVVAFMTLLALVDAAEHIPEPKTMVTITTASGEAKEIPYDEFQAMQRQADAMQQKVRNTDDGEWKHDQRIDDIERQDPRLALQIRLATAAFKEMQRHGYAKGYALTSFTESESTVITSKAEQSQGAKKEYQIIMQLRAEIDKTSKDKPNPGTSAKKRANEPTSIAYDVELLLDKDDVASIVRAWELRSDNTRGKQLSIKKSDALLTRIRNKKQQQLQSGWLPGSSISSWLLAGGVSLIAIGVAVIFLTPRDTPTPTATPTDKRTSPNAKSKKPKRKTSDPGEQWELANGK